MMPKPMYGAETWGMRSADRRRVNVLEITCLRSMAEAIRMERVGNEKVSRRSGIERDLTGRMVQIVLRWFGHVERIILIPYA